MRLRSAAFLASVAALLCGPVQALEPVDPQPARPLTFEHPSYQKVTPAEAKKMIDAGEAVVIDVRERDEFAEGHVKGAVNVPLSGLMPGMKLMAAPKLDQKILVQCRSGVRAENAARILIETGYKKVYNMYGTSQWPYGLVR